MAAPIRVVVVDDDFLIARMHAQYVVTQPGYQVVATARSYMEAQHALTVTQPDLLILDVYLPDGSGIDLLREVRTSLRPCDVILITAAKEMHVVQDGFRLGVFDYLIKPFNLERLSKSLHNYAQYRARLAQNRSVDQQAVDDLKTILAPPSRPTEAGVDQRTLERIRACLAGHNQPLSAEEVAQRAGVSRSTARLYLAHLVRLGQVEEDLIYGNVGRPRRLFRLHT
ncbi:MAG: response regulator [Alicyclobacillus sp.]|nr:response regulator [Alicyclobacillus sp.]